MIYIYGDSHANALFKNLKLTNHNLYQTSVTMHRIGRDNTIVGFDSNCNNNNSIICFVYGEIDCRCHIYRQIQLDRQEDDIIRELVENYINTIKNNITIYKHIIIIAVIPPVERKDFEEINGIIQHEYPILGDDEDRVRYNVKINHLLEIYSIENNFIFLNPFNYYKKENGCLDYSFSDKNIHIEDNTYFLNEFYQLLENITNYN